MKATSNTNSDQKPNRNKPSDERELKPTMMNDSALLNKINLSQVHNQLIKNPISDIFFLVNDRSKNDVEKQKQALNTYLEYNDSIQKLFNENQILRDKMQNLEDFMARQKARKIELDISGMRFKNESARKLFISTANSYFYKLFYQSNNNSEEKSDAKLEYDTLELKRLFDECVISPARDPKQKVTDNHQQSFRIENFINNVYIQHSNNTKDDAITESSLFRQRRDDYKTRKFSKTPDSDNTSVKSQRSQSVKVDNGSGVRLRIETSQNLIDQLNLAFQTKGQINPNIDFNNIAMSPVDRDKGFKGYVDLKRNVNKNMQLSAVNDKKHLYSIYNNHSYQNNAKNNNERATVLEDKIGLTEINTSSFMDESKNHAKIDHKIKLLEFQTEEPLLKESPKKLEERPSAKILKTKNEGRDITGIRLFSRPSDCYRGVYRQVDDSSIINTNDFQSNKRINTELTDKNENEPQNTTPVAAITLNGFNKQSIGRTKGTIYQKTGSNIIRGHIDSQQPLFTGSIMRDKRPTGDKPGLGSSLARLFRSESGPRHDNKLFGGPKPSIKQKINNPVSYKVDKVSNRPHSRSLMANSTTNGLTNRISHEIRENTLKKPITTLTKTRKISSTHFSTLNTKNKSSTFIPSIRCDKPKPKSVKLAKYPTHLSPSMLKHEVTPVVTIETPNPQTSHLNTTKNKNDATSSFNYIVKDFRGSFCDSLYIRVDNTGKKKQEQSNIDMNSGTKPSQKSSSNCFDNSGSRDPSRRFHTFKPDGEFEKLSVDHNNPSIGVNLGVGVNKGENDLIGKEGNRVVSMDGLESSKIVRRPSMAKQTKAQDLASGVRRLTRDFKRDTMYKPNFFEKSYKKYTRQA